MYIAIRGRKEERKRGREREREREREKYFVSFINAFANS